MKYRQQGYIVLLLSIIVTTVGVFLALNAAVVSSQAGKNNQAIQQSQKAESTARRCAELVFGKLQTNRYYEGDEALDFPNGDECYVYAISGVGNAPRTIITSASDTNTTRFMETRLSSVAPRIQIESQSLIVDATSSSDLESQALIPNSPSQVQSESLALWLRPSTILSNNGATLSEWIDVRNTITLSQSALAERPTYQSRSQNGRPGVLFGLDDSMTSPSLPAILSNPNRVILGVVQFEGQPEPQLITTASGWSAPWVTTPQGDIFVGNDLEPDGEILELIVYSQAVTGENRTALQTYLTTKYDL